MEAIYYFLVTFANLAFKIQVVLCFSLKVSENTIKEIYFASKNL